MTWLLQTPGAQSPKLLANFVQECGSAARGGAAFAFASAAGVKLLAAEPLFQKFLAGSNFTMIIGLDAITDTKAIDALQKLKSKFPKFVPKLFVHKTAGSIFHPKTIWLRSAQGGVTITGSGNLTAGGLRRNWEVLTIEKFTSDEMNQIEKSWDLWIAAHKKELLDVDDEKALEKAKANQIQHVRIKKALKQSNNDDAEGEAEAEATDEAIEEALHDLMVNPVLIAEVPKSGNRWKQINFDIKTYQAFFGVTLGKGKDVEFHRVQGDGSLGPSEKRHAVAVKSQNYRFEIGAAHGLSYPDKGHPIVVFERVADAEFNYLLLMPQSAAHQLVQKYLDSNYPKTKGKRRVTITAGALQSVWPTSPLFI